MFGRNVKRLFSSIIVVVVGIACIIVGSIIIKSNNSITWSDPITGTIAEIKTIDRGVDESNDHEVYVTYTYEGTEYTEKYDKYAITMDVGEEVTVYVDVDSPRNITSSTSNVMPICFIVGGALVILGGAFGVFKSFIGVA